MAGSLDGLRIVDMTGVALGPFATMMLAEQGAEVIKVESPAGDTTRHVGRSKTTKGMGPHHLFVNRNKRSLCLDLKRPEARAALLKVIARADALVYSFRPQAMAKLGLAYEDLVKINPSIVYAGAYGYSLDGPYGDRPAYDDAIQAISGYAALVAGTAFDGVDGGVPKYAPTVLADKTVGLTFAYAILCALMHKVRTGEGQKVEVPMFETMASWLALEHLWERTYRDDGDLGYSRLTSPHRKPYRAKDGWLAILPYTDRHWTKFFTLSGRPEIMDDPRYSTMAQRSLHIGDLYAMLDEVTPTRTVAEWLTALEAAEIPATPVKTLAQVIDDPHMKARGMFRKVEHHSEGELLNVEPPVKFDKTPSRHLRGAPLLGEDSAAILREAGLSDAEVAALKASGAAITL